MTTNARVHPLLEKAAAHAWRLLVVAAATVAVLWLVGRLWVVFLPLVIALLLGRALSPCAGWLREHGWRPGLAAAAVLLGFLLIVSGGATLVGVAVGSEAQDIGSTVSQAVDDIEQWLVEDAPIAIDQRDIDRLRERAGDGLQRWSRSAGSSVISGAVVALETVVSMFLGLIVTFFLLKDGDRLVGAIQRAVPSERREVLDRLGRRSWQTLGGYLRGAALLGVVEGTIIGVTMAIVGAELAVVVGVIVFALAFVPFVGAIVSGILAVLITLATGGGTAALVVLAVTVLVQQFDNDLLAPLVYGRQLDLHPVVVLLSIVGGGALFGPAGTILAVPVTAVLLNGLAELRPGDPPAIEAETAGG